MPVSENRIQQQTVVSTQINDV